MSKETITPKDVGSASILELDKEQPKIKLCCKKLERVRVIKTTTIEYVKDAKTFKKDREISENITVLCGECYIQIPAGKRLTKILKGLSEGLG